MRSFGSQVNMLHAGKIKDLATSNKLREWFDHGPPKWEEFKTRCFLELDGKLGVVSELATIAKERKITLIVSAKNDKMMPLQRNLTPDYLAG